MPHDARMSGETWAVYAVDSSAAKYTNATYTIDDMDDDSIQVYVDYADGNHDAVVTVEEQGLSDADLLAEIDRQLRAQGLPPRGAVLLSPN